MATFHNRSRLAVSVPGRTDLTRQFPHTKLNAARDYLRALRAEDHSPVLTQGDEAWGVRIRRSGSPKMNFRAGSYEEALHTAQRIEAEQATGLFIDYTAGHRVIFADLIERYIDEVCPSLKSCEVDTASLESFLSDLSPAYAQRMAERKIARDLKAGRTRRRMPSRHIPRSNIEWLLRPIAKVVATDLHRYIGERLEQELAPATIDREMDRFSAVITWATKTLRIELHRTPMYGLKRPSYFNERDRRLSADEHERLFAAAREEDRLLGREAAIERALTPAREHASGLPNAAARKRYVDLMRARARERITSWDSPPYYETFFTVLRYAAPRRSEVLALTWAHVRLQASEAYLPTTKNGRSRTIALREHVIEALERLPRTGERVFPMSENQVRSAWYRICERAGLTGENDYHMHDLRHEAVSDLCEVARAAKKPFTVMELATFTGHRDLRSLARYMNLCSGELAHRIDEAYKEVNRQKVSHKGRVRPHIYILPSVTVDSQPLVSVPGYRGGRSEAERPMPPPVNKRPC
jgi:integrase